MGTKKTLAAVLAAALILLVLAPLSGIASGGNVTISAVIGYDGAITYVRYIPLTVTVENHGGDVRGVIGVELARSNVEYDRYEYPLTLAAGAAATVEIPVLLNYKQAEYRVEFVADSTVIAETTVEPVKVIAPSTLLVGVVSPDPTSMAYLNINSGSDELRRVEYWQTLPLTAESFPNSERMLSAFDIIALDGGVEGGFSAAQAQAIEAWVNAGGVLIVGGGARAASGYAVAQGMTSVTAGTPYQTTGVQSALETYLNETQGIRGGSGNDGSNYLVVPINGDCQEICALDGSGLISRVSVGAGAVYLTAFSLSDRPLSGWSGMNCFWQKVLLAEDDARYQEMVYNRMNTYFQENETYADQSALRQMKLDNRENLIPAAIVVLLFVALAGFGSYILLRRIDKRGWMWVTVPCLSVLAAVVLALMSGNMALNQPAAVMYSLVSVDESGTADITTIAGVASARTGAVKIGTPDGETIVPSDASYWWEEKPVTDEDEAFSSRLRYLYTLGSESGITMQEKSAWNVEQLVIRRGETLGTPVHATVWWEDDGLHGSIVNDTDLSLDAGWVFSSYGFCSVPALLPGETCEFSILEDVSGKRTTYFRDGVILNAGGNYQPYFDYYSLVSGAVYPEYQGVEDTSGLISAEDLSERRWVESLVSYAMNTLTSYNTYGKQVTDLFRYIAFTRDIPPVSLTVDGDMVERVTAENVISVEVSYTPVGKSGVARYSYGQTEMTVGRMANGVPEDTGVAASRTDWYELKTLPVFCFRLSEGDRIRLDNLSFYCESDYAGTPAVYLYSFAANDWVEISDAMLPVWITQDAAQFLSSAGEVFVRLEAQPGSRMSQVYGACLAAEGRVK